MYNSISMIQAAPNVLFEVMAGFMTARYLTVARQLNLFAILANRPATLEEISQRLAMPRRTTRILVDALAATGFVIQENKHYQNGRPAGTFTSQSSLADLGLALRLWDELLYRQAPTLEKKLRQNPVTSSILRSYTSAHASVHARAQARLWRHFILPTLTRLEDNLRQDPVAAILLRHRPVADFRAWWSLWQEIVYPQWAGLEQSLRQDQATFRFDDFSREQWLAFTQGIELLTARSAETLARSYDFRRHRRLLDLGGGIGTFSIAALQRHKNLEATLFEWPVVAALARARLANTPLATSVGVVEGDLFETPLPVQHDLIILANVAHLFSPDRNLALLQRIRLAVPDGTRLLLVDFWTDPTHTQPPFAALMAGGFQTISGEGDVYSQEEAFSWLRESGWRPLAHRPLAEAMSFIVAEADTWQ